MNHSRAKPWSRRFAVFGCAVLLLLATGCQTTGSTTSKTEREPTPTADASLTIVGWLLYMFAGY